MRQQIALSTFNWLNEKNEGEATWCCKTCDRGCGTVVTEVMELWLVGSPIINLDQILVSFEAFGVNKFYRVPATKVI